MDGDLRAVARGLPARVLLVSAEAFIAANPDIEAVEAFVTDFNGVARGKLLRASELVELDRAGRPLPGSILHMDSTGMEVDALVWTTGDADLMAHPVPGTLRRAAWRAVPTAQVLLSMPDDPRSVLAGVVARMMAAGYRPVVAAELEFYIVDPRGTEGMVQPLGNQIDGSSVTALEEMSPFLDELFACAKVMDLPAEAAISEYGPAQLEIVLRHRADALRAADDAVMWKRLVRGVAMKHGLLATFMAKPFTDRAGSGLHIHASLDDAAGQPAFASEQLMHHAIGGLLATLEDSLAIFAPNANSYRRFQAQSYAPTSGTWGINNRTVAVRIPTGVPHLEHRVAGADANPYLAIAAVLAGMHEGIEKQLDPGPPVEGYVRGSWDWHSAMRRFRDSHFIADYFGERFVATYAAIKTAEYERFQATVTELDLDWYLTRA